MTLQMILYALIFLFSSCMLAYEGMAEKYNLKVGSKSSWFTIAGGVVLFVSVLRAFFVFKWWIVLLLLVGAYLAGGLITAFFRSWLRIIAPIVTVICIIWLILL